MKAPHVTLCLAQSVPPRLDARSLLPERLPMQMRDHLVIRGEAGADFDGRSDAQSLLVCRCAPARWRSQRAMVMLV